MLQSLGSWPDVLLLLCRWFAGGVLVASGLLKLGRSGELEASLVPMGFPQRLVQTWIVRVFAVRAFPHGEIVLGLGVIAAPAWFGMVALAAATALYVGFLAITARVVVRGDRAECECFGGLSDGAVTWRTVLRNIVFLLAVILAWRAPTSELWAAVGAMLFALCLGGVLVMLRSARERRARREALAGLLLDTIDGRRVPITDVVNRPLALVFLSASCSNCQVLARQISERPVDVQSERDLAVVLMGKRIDFDYFDAFTPLLAIGNDGRTWLDTDKSVSRAMGRLGTPGLVLVDPASPLGNEWVLGIDRIRSALSLS